MLPQLLSFPALIRIALVLAAHRVVSPCKLKYFLERAFAKCLFDAEVTKIMNTALVKQPECWLPKDVMSITNECCVAQIFPAFRSQIPKLTESQIPLGGRLCQSQ
jgi:hypothetical protein